MAEPRQIDPNYKSARKNGKCYRGHPMTQKNTYVQPSGYTVCRRCKADREREAYRARCARRAREKANG